MRQDNFRKDSRNENIKPGPSDEFNLYNIQINQTEYHRHNSLEMGTLEYNVYDLSKEDGSQKKSTRRAEEESLVRPRPND
jgi:hypothetical protein